MISFSKAFAAARKAGKKTFTWNGNRYTTKLASTPKTPKNIPVPGKRPTKSAGTAKATSRPKADYPKPARAVGIARPGSGLSKIVARQENKPKASEKVVQGPQPEGVWYARKGSPISLAAARRANKPVPKTAKSAGQNAATAFAIGMMKNRKK